MFMMSGCFDDTHPKLAYRIYSLQIILPPRPSGAAKEDLSPEKKFEVVSQLFCIIKSPSLFPSLPVGANSPFSAHVPSTRQRELKRARTTPTPSLSISRKKDPQEISTPDAPSYLPTSLPTQPTATAFPGNYHLLEILTLPTDPPLSISTPHTSRPLHSLPAFSTTY
jgi:hypothetical protein